MLTDSKALQLLEFLIKNGSERVIDDARSHLSLLKMLRQFHYIDQNGKDQGINVRNRSKELAELLGDVDRIRAERKKARSNRNKFGGVSGGAISTGMSSGSRYGGFGSEDAGGYGGYSGGVYGDGGGFGGNTSNFQDTGRRDRFEEYDEYDEGAVAAPGRRKTEANATTRRETKMPEPPKKKEPEIDILAFDDDIPPETPPKEMALNGKKAAPSLPDNGLGSLQAAGADDDDFDDFQSAASTTVQSTFSTINPPTKTSATVLNTQFAAPKPVSASQENNINDLVGFSTISPSPSTSSVISPPASNYAPQPPSAFTSPPPSAFASPPVPPPINQQQSKPTSYQATTPNYFTSVPVAPISSSQPSSAIGAKSSTISNTSFNKSTQPKPSLAGGDAFGSLWSTASATAGIKSTSTPGSSGPRLADMAKEKASAGIWGASAPSSSTAQSQPQSQAGQTQTGGQKLGGSLNDLLG